MAETYCGKSCAQCPHKEATNCPGCRVGPGRQYGGDCEVAQCVRTKGQESCQACQLRGNCAGYRGCHRLPEYRRKKQEAEQQLKDQWARRAPVLGQWLSLLFWLIIPNILASLLTNDTFADSTSGFYRFGTFLEIACMVASGVILLQLGTEEDGYRTAGIYSLIACGVSVLTMVLDLSLVMALLVSVAAAVLELISEYHEFTAHSAVLEDVDRELSHQWTVLWKWFFGLFVAMYAALLMLSAVPRMAALVMLGSAIGILVVSIMKMVYLYRTAKRFKEYHQN